MELAGGDGGDRDRGEWITATEAAELLGLVQTTMRNRCCKGTQVARKVIVDGRWQWLLRRDDVEAELEEREYKVEMEARGLRRCSSCREWKSRRGFWKGQNQCIECIKGLAKAPQQEIRRPWAGISDPVAGEVRDYVRQGRPAGPEDSLKYACMDRAFAHRPIPIGSTKRSAFCAVCTAPRCVHHVEMTPQRVCRTGRVPTLYRGIDVRILLEEETPAGMTMASGG